MKILHESYVGIGYNYYQIKSYISLMFINQLFNNKTYKKMTKISIIIILIFTIGHSACTSSSTSSNSNEENISSLSEDVKRVGMVIRLEEDMIEEYKKIHADDHNGVRDLLVKYNIRNFSIFLIQLEDGNYYEFGYYEYVGDNFEDDMKKLAAEPRNQAWLEVTDAMQIPLHGNTSWTEMEQIFFNP